MLRIITLNLNGIRSAAKKGLFNWLARQRADVLCVQEVKAQPGDLSADIVSPGAFKSFFHCADKRGYSGVGLYSRRLPSKVTEGIGIEDVEDLIADIQEALG